MVLDSDKSEGNVLEEFDLDGVSAQVVMVQPGDLDSEMKKALAENLANTNFVYLDMPEAKSRHAVKELLLETREQILGKDSEGREAALKELEAKLEKGELAKVQGVDEVKAKIERLTHLVRGVMGEVDDDFINQQFGQMGDSIYPDYAKSEHVRGYQRRFDILTENVSLLGVKVDDKIVAVVGYAKVGDTPSGREVFEFTKGSTLDDPRFRRKGFLKKMMKLASERVQAEHPEVVWVGASVNSIVIGSFRSKGWHVVDIDDSNEAIVAMNSRNPDYVKTLKEQKYKAFYFDPKVDKIK